MKSKIKNILSATLAVSLMALTVIGIMPNAYAASTASECRQESGAANIAACAACITAGGTWAAPNCTGVDNADPDELIVTVLNWMLVIIGILCVVFIIWGGITYTMSRGDSKKVESAKNTILYAVVGLVIALLALAIVNFVLSAFLGGGTTTTT